MRLETGLFIAWALIGIALFIRVALPILLIFNANAISRVLKNIDSEEIKAGETLAVLHWLARIIRSIQLLTIIACGPAALIWALFNRERLINFNWITCDDGSETRSESESSGAINRDKY